jgi:hypothetical protein
MEKFLVLRTLTDQTVANNACAALEDTGIPVMLEHVVIETGDGGASGYRILVPSQFTQSAMGLIDRVVTQHRGRRLEPEYRSVA